MKEKLFDNVCEDSVFEKLYEKLSTELCHLFYYKFGALLSPEDKVQEAFIKLWENCAKVSPDKAKSFLYTLTNNALLNEVKHHKVVLKYQQLNHKSSSNESPEFLLEKEEYFGKYQSALEKLTEEQRTAFLLNKAEGKKHEEIAEILGVTRKVVEYRIYSAFKLLKTELEGFNIK